jgi:hypothetical protein
MGHVCLYKIGNFLKKISLPTKKYPTIQNISQFFSKITENFSHKKEGKWEKLSPHPQSRFCSSVSPNL